MTQRIDMSRVNLDVVMPWITEHFNYIYNIEDFLNEELKREQPVCPKIFQLKLLRFLNIHKVQQFTTDLWQILLLSQASGMGMPPFVMEQIKKDEILKREEEIKRKWKDSSKCRHCSCCRCSRRDCGVVDDKNPNQFSSKQEKARSLDKQLDNNASPPSCSKYNSVQRDYPSSDSCSPQSLKTYRSKQLQKKRDNSCNRNSISHSKPVEKQGASSTSEYNLRRCNDTSDDSDESPQCAWCGRSSSSSQSSVSSNRSHSPRR